MKLKKFLMWWTVKPTTFLFLFMLFFLYIFPCYVNFIFILAG